MIYVQPHSGLANRIRVIISALHFAEEKKQPLTILWNKEKNFYCDFEVLFEMNDRFKVKNISWVAPGLQRLLSKNLSKIVLIKLFSIDIYISDEDIKQLVWDTGTNDIDCTRFSGNEKNFYFFTCHEFYFDKFFLNYLQPVPKIRSLIKDNILHFTPDTIGIHIRRTDHILSIQESPLELFIEAITREILINKDVQFYLATDDFDTESHLLNLFPKKILTYKKVFRRDIKNGIQDAMIDLYSLAATSKIYGSFYSSFSDIAARIGNISLQIIKKS